MSAADKPQKRRGRPPLAEIASDPIEIPVQLDEDLVVKSIALSEIDLDDTTYRFRAVVRVPELIKSIRESGQQIPAVVRPNPHEDTGFSYQLVSGFRRAAALTELGAKTISAYVRRDLVTDEETFRASVLENIARRTYSDIDRAYIIRRHKEAGHLGIKVAALMGMSDRQMRNLTSLLELPKVVQEALGDDSTAFKATHALTLKKLKTKYPRLAWAEWIGTVNAEGLSISQMIRRVNARHERKGERQLPSIFRDDGTNLDEGLVRLRPIAFDVTAMRGADREKLRGELNALLARLDAAAGGAGEE